MINLKNKKGYEGSFYNILTGLILLGLFGALILTSVVQSGAEYSKDTSQVGGVNRMNDFTNSISDVQTKAQNIQTTFKEGSIWSAIAGVVVDGMFGIVKGLFEMILTPFGIVTDLMIDVAGIPAIVVWVITGIFIFGIIFAIWRLIKIGE